MPAYFDDNYGAWNIESEDDIEFYREVQANSVEKICRDCGNTVRIRRDYAICNSCADKIERGFQY